MAEKHIPRLEQHESYEKTVDHEHHEKVAKHIEQQAEQARRDKSAENLEKIQELARQQAETSDKVKLEQTPKDETESLVGMQHSLKATAYTRTLSRLQQKLPKPIRAFSKVAHNPVVDKISSVGAETVARPSGVLGGSICAFVGSVVFLYYSKHYGFRYNYLLVFLLLAGGYVIGATIELFIWLFYSRKQRY